MISGKDRDNSLMYLVLHFFMAPSSAVLGGLNAQVVSG